MCRSGGWNAVAARGSSWFSRKRSERFWKSGTRDEAIVEPLVVGVVEAGLLQLPLHVPVHLGHEHELRPPPLDARDGVRPERRVLRRRAVAGLGPVAPRALEDLRLHEHGHVAANGVAALGDAAELAHHGLAQPGVPIVELDGVRPPREVGIAAEGEHARAASDREAAPVLRLAREVIIRALDEELGVRGDPRVVGRDVVGHEVAQQLEPVPREPLAEPRQRRVAAEVAVDGVGLDGER
jgi:hypothetical protein